MFAWLKSIVSRFRAQSSTQDVDRVVAMLTGLTRAEVAALVEAGNVAVGGRPVTTRSRRLAEGDVVEALLLDDAARLEAFYKVAVLAWSAADEARRGVNRLLLILPICLLLVLIVSRL